MKGVIRKVKAKGKATLLDRGRGKIVSGLKEGTTSKQLEFLSQALDSGSLSTRELRRQLEGNAVKEMHKGVIRITREGRIPTVDELLEEYRSETEFQGIAARVGLDEPWFVALAESVCGGKDA
ncbi:MAG: hypothetical protein KKD77_21690 [Gammaproteobacteria bacterium]|nr:hypothetical protein [Gammaproteobacteria bacterium]